MTILKVTPFRKNGILSNSRFFFHSSERFQLYWHIEGGYFLVRLYVFQHGKMRFLGVSILGVTESVQIGSIRSE